MTAQSFRVGWIGSGLMGLPMARHVLAAGHDVTVFARTPARAAPLVQAGAGAARTVADAVRGADVVVTIVSAPADVEQIYLGEDGVLANAAAGTVAVDMTTSAPDLARRITEASADRGITVLDAPVSGGPAGAQAGALSVMVGGDADGLQRVRPVLDAFASEVVHHGLAGSGQLAKLVNQTLVAGITLAACEAFVLARTGGLDVELVADSVRPGVAGSSLFDFVWSRLREGDLEPGFRLDHLRKDLGLVAEAAGDVELPGTALVTELVDKVRHQRGGDCGTQALVTALMEWPT
ncbi:NAD(P)-dependent oxidoreductase [Phytoactinopolyspora alkaliphila]|uniref:NAD(P)-dependent oxidoreductase n=1 Tax=Phytoactinopolyspora alkaliphila TaxID=1783498 RepID=A0A6N9YS49_9ACTN|nr:NAD(P)-dependent oxidoreductase [Phytoactinopolyspora alkaliphila]NED97863.1 NAD(P)-dependent oxidoreductase [Phytoactinopolyspora alkaliphila]